MDPGSFYQRQREEFVAILQGPGITWNLKGILAAYDQATARAYAAYLTELENRE